MGLLASLGLSLPAARAVADQARAAVDPLETDVKESPFPGVSQDTLSNAAKATAQERAAKPATKPPTHLEFRPALQMLTQVPGNGVPQVIHAGEEKTIDMLIENWSDDAPEGATIDWKVVLSGRGASAEVVPDEGLPGYGYLTVKALASGGLVAVKVVVIIRYGEIIKPFDLRTFLFMSGPAKVDPSVEDARLVDGGERANQSDLNSALSDLLQDWQTAALAGLNDFADQQLKKKIDDLTAGSWATFFESLAGNLLWAATVFNVGGKFVIKALDGVRTFKNELVPGQIASFTISLVGIGVPAGLNTPDGASEPSFETTKAILQEAAQTWYQHMQKVLTPRIRDMATKLAGASQFELSGKLAQQIFKPGCVQVDGKYQLKPTINGTFVSRRYNAIATAMFEKALAQGKKHWMERAVDDHEHKRIKANKPPGT
jgi:hypothetical protein